MQRQQQELSKELIEEFLKPDIQKGIVKAIWLFLKSHIIVFVIAFLLGNAVPFKINLDNLINFLIHFL